MRPANPLSEARRFAVGLLLSAPLLAGAQAPPTTAATSPTTSTLAQARHSRVDRVGTPAPMSLADVVLAAMDRNLEIEIRSLGTKEGAQETIIARSIYDTVLAGKVSHTHYEGESASASTVTGGRARADDAVVTRSRNDHGHAELQQLLPTGAAVYAGYSNDRDELFDLPRNSTAISPTTRQRAYVGARQPLLKNSSLWGPDPTNLDIRIARKREAISNALYQQEVINQIAATMRAYWDLVFALGILDVQKASLDSAVELERVNRVRVQTGNAARAELLQATAQAASRRNAVIAAQSAIIDAQDNLLRLLNARRLKAEWDRPIQPTDSPTNYNLALAYDDDLLVAEAVASRPDLQAEHLNVDIAELNSDVARWQRLPEVNLFAEVGSNGLDDGPGGAYDDVEDTQYVDYTAGVEFRYALRNRRARAEYARSLTVRERAGRELERAELDIVRQVRAANRAIRTAQESIEASTAQVAATEESLKAERRRLEVGSSTTFRVLDLQDDVASARAALLKAQTDFQKGMIELNRSQGTLLRTLGRELGIEMEFEARATGVGLREMAPGS